MEENTGLNRYHELQATAKELGITERNVTAEQLEAAIEAKKMEPAKTEPIEEPKIGLTTEEAAKIDARLKYEFEVQEKFRIERQIQTDRATIMTESESLKIPIELPEKPTELELAKARQLLGIKKLEVRPSPETVAIESSKRGYYEFVNREQDDASHTVCPGGKYIIHLIAGQIHVLSEAHIKLFRKNAVTPIYSRVPVPGLVPGPETVGHLKEECKRTGSKPRFAFEYLGEAPQDASFGMVTDMKILDKLNQPV